MAGRKRVDKQITVGNITRVSGKVTIAGGDIYEGYTAEQVSILLEQITTKYQRKSFDGRCPYKGLSVFEEEDADLFFGRERLVEDLVSRVKESRTVFITGPSGSGKSSLVRAGLIHTLKEGAIRNSKSWSYEIIKPGREPLKELALVFSRLKSPELADYFQAHMAEADILHRCAESVLSGRKDQRFVLFVDQFEEVFTQVNQESERRSFLEMLAHAGTVEDGRVIVLFAMRSDFISNCAAYAAINELLSQQFRQIGAMQPEELVSAIALPAKEVGLPIEEELVAQIINDMKGEPGALPLMQFALQELFEARQAKGKDIALTLEDYLERGGIQKILARHADETFNGLSTEQQELARSIFSGLIEIGKGRQDTRRIAFFEDLIPANTNTTEVETVVQKLADARLIITDEQAGKDTVTISHERLITAWPWLEKLINENRDVIALQNEIKNDAKEWDDHKRDQSYLYTGARLANAQEQLDAKKLNLSDLAHVFVDAGIELELTEQKEEERRRQKELEDAQRLAEAEAKRAEIEKQRAEEQARSAINLRKRSVYLTGALVAALMAVGLAMFFWAQSRQQTVIAREQATTARARELSTQAILQRDKNFLVSLLLGVEAFHTMDLPITRGVLLDNAVSSPHLIRYLSGHSSSVLSVAFSPDGKTLVSGSDDSTIILWDVASHTPIGQPLQGHGGDKVMSVAFSPNGNTLASGSADSTITLWDVKTRQSIGELNQWHLAPVLSVVFSPDGNTLASGGADDTIILWDVKTGKPIGETLRGPAPSTSSVTLAFSPDGRILASGFEYSTVILWDVKTHQLIGELLHGNSDTVRSVAFSPDGSTLASSSDDGTIILWDVKTGKPIGEPLQGHSAAILSIVFSPDGKVLASGSVDSIIIFWDAKTRQPIGEPLQGHSSSVSSVAFSPDGKTLASGGYDAAIILWDVKTRQPIGEPLQGHRGSVSSVAFSPDGKTLASGSDDNTIILWDVGTGQPIGKPFQGYIFGIRSMAFSPDGKSLASGSAAISTGSDSTIVLWDVKTRQPIWKPLQGHPIAVSSVAFSPDGKILVWGSNDNTIIFWDAKTYQPIGKPLPGYFGITSMAFSPDGKILAAGGAGIILWDVDTHLPVGQPLNGDGRFIAFSPDSKILASGGKGNIIVLWDVETQQPIGQPLKGHSDIINSVAFSPDGNTLASGSNDNTIILWDVKTGQPIGAPLQGHSSSVSSVAFSLDGKTLASGSTDSTIILWDVNPQSWVEKSCQRAGRNFTRAEWAQYFPNEEYRKTCPQWSLESEPTAVPSPTP